MTCDCGASLRLAGPRSPVVVSGGSASMKTGAATSGVGLAAALLCAIAVAACTTADRTDDPVGSGCTVTGVRVVGHPRAAVDAGLDGRWPADPARAVRARMSRGDDRFKVWMAHPLSGRAYFPGLSRAEGARLGRTAGVVVEVIDEVEIFPVERDPSSARARLGALDAAMARFNRALFRELDRRGRIAAPASHRPPDAGVASPGIAIGGSMGRPRPRAGPRGDPRRSSRGRRGARGAWPRPGRGCWRGPGTGCPRPSGR